MLTMEEKQKLAKEQEQQRMYKAQSPLTLKSDKQKENKRPTSQVKDLTSSLMTSNLTGLKSSAATNSTPNYQQTGQSSLSQNPMPSNYNAVGQKPQNSISTYNPMGQSGNKPNYSGGGIMGNMSTGSTFGGQSYGGQFGGQGQQTMPTTQKNLSAFDNLLPSSAQTKPSLSQMSSVPRQNNPNSMNFNSQQNSMTGGNFNAYGGNFNTSPNVNMTNTYGGFQSPAIPNMSGGSLGFVGQNMGGSAMFNKQQVNPMNSQNTLGGMQPMGTQQFTQSQPAKKLGQSELDDLLG